MSRFVAFALLLIGLASAGKVGQKGSYVCTETFKAGLTSFFVQRDSKVAFAQDQSELCELCAKITRLGYLYTNDVQTANTWAKSLQDSACAYVTDRRRADCQTLARSIIVSQQKHFDGKDSKFKPKELRGSTEQLSLLVDSKSYGLCKQMGCCPINPQPGKDNVVRPCDKKGDKRDMEKDLKSLQQDRFYLNKLREELFLQRRTNNEQKAKQDLHEIDLKGREEKLKREQLALKNAQEKLKSAKAALKRREDKNSRHEGDLKKKEEWLKKYEHNIKVREDLVKEREELAYRREEKLDIPHPPKKIPGAAPPPLPADSAPKAPPSSF